MSTLITCVSTCDVSADKVLSSCFCSAHSNPRNKAMRKHWEASSLPSVSDSEKQESSSAGGGGAHLKHLEFGESQAGADLFVAVPGESAGILNDTFLS